MEKLEKLINTQDELIILLHNQIVDLTLMSKIELGDDVIEEITKLNADIQQIKLEIWDQSNT
jgi:hypothetical protein